MKQVLLDSNFVITCVKQKIDFLEKIESLGLEILVPSQVLKEIEKLAERGRSLKLRDHAKLSLKILKSENVKKVNLPSRNVDTGIKRFADQNPEIIIATLDSELKQRTKNQKLVIRNRNNLQII